MLLEVLKASSSILPVRKELQPGFAVWPCRVSRFCPGSALSSLGLLNAKPFFSFQLQSSGLIPIFVHERFPQQISRLAPSMSSRSLTGFNRPGLAVSCPRHNKAHQETRSNHQSTYADVAHDNTCTCRRARTRRSTEATQKGRKATQQKERSSRRRRSHPILCSARRHKVQIKAGRGDYPGGVEGGGRGLRGSGCFPAGESVICQLQSTFV